MIHERFERGRVTGRSYHHPIMRGKTAASLLPKADYLMTSTTDPTGAVITLEPAASKAATTRATVRAQARHMIIAQLISESSGRAPTHLQLLNELRRRGVKTSKGTVMNDLRALGFSNAQSAYTFRTSLTTHTKK